MKNDDFSQLTLRELKEQLNTIQSKIDNCIADWEYQSYVSKKHKILKAIALKEAK